MLVLMTATEGRQVVDSSGSLSPRPCYLARGFGPAAWDHQELVGGAGSQAAPRRQARGLDLSKTQGMLITAADTEPCL